MLPDDDDDDDEDDDDNDEDDDDDVNRALLVKNSADSGNYQGSETEDSAYYASSRAKELDTLMSNMSLSRLMAGAPEKHAPMGGVDQVHQTTKTKDDNNTNDVLTIGREDLTEIMDRLDTIRENESRIRSLLKKYQL